MRGNNWFKGLGIPFISFMAILTLLFGLNVGSAKALPTTVNLTINYYRDAGDYSAPAGSTGPWNVWIWKDAPGAADDVAVNAPKGNAFTLPTGTKVLDSWNYSAKLKLTIKDMSPVHTQIGFIVRLGLWDATDVGFDRFITNIDPVSGNAEIWLKQGDKNVYTSVPRLGPGIKSASVDDFRKITVNLNRAPAAGTSAGNFSLCSTSSPTTPTSTATPTPSGTPSIPQNLTVTAGSARTFLKWNHSTNTTSYKVFRTTVTKPAVPAGLAATAGNSKVFLKWSHVSGATSYKVYRGTSFSKVTDLQATVNTNGFTDTTAVNGTSYYYAVRASNAAGDSANTSAVLTKPVATATATAMPTPTPSLAAALSFPTTALATTTANGYTDTTAANDTTYLYAVSASNGANDSVLTSPVAATPTAANSAQTMPTPTPSNLVIPTATPTSTTSTTCGRTGVPGISTATINGSVVTLGLDSDVTLGTNYIVSLKDKNNIDFGSQKTYSGKILISDKFNANFVYSGEDLGATYSQSSTKFRVWAPTATALSVKIYDTATSALPSTTVPMTKDVNGTWIATASGDLNGKIYMYGVTVDDRTLETIDPYVRATTINGTRGVILDLTKTDPTNWVNDKAPAFSGSATDAIVYELHVRDLSMDSTSGYPTDQKGKFSALTNFNTTYCSITAPAGSTNWTCPAASLVKTGMGAIKDLGITHLELLPVYDFGSVNEASPTFNWGYDPQNPNVPEGSYSSDPNKPSARILELKQGVQAIHSNGMRVVMDVIYNHVMNPNTFSQESLVPGYFFRTDDQGNLTNQSGCGNDIASERPMVRKYIVDSAVYWAKQYHIDGFRFDIMSLVDKVTMGQVRDALKKVDPSIIVFGEGWSYDENKAKLAYSMQSRQANAGNAELQGIGFFNDQMRDGIKGDTGSDTLPGYVNGLASNYVNQVINGVFGQTATNFNSDKAGSRSWTATTPGQSVNYVEVHDGLTLWDKLKAANTFGASDTVLQRQGRQAASLVLLSQGMPFLHAGQEFLRSKGGNANSYAPPDSATTTQAKLDWELKTNSLKWNQALTNKANVDYYRGLIALRKAHPLFRMNSVAEINKRFEWLGYFADNGLGFMYKNTAADSSKLGDSWNRIVFATNPNDTGKTLTLPTGTWYVVVNDVAAGTATLATITNNKVTVPANSTVVLTDTKP